MNWLPFFMEKARLTGPQLAKLVDAKPNEIWRLINWPEGKNTRPMTKDWAERLAPHLGTTPAALLYGPEGQEPISGVREEAARYNANTEPPENRDAVECLLRGRTAAHAWKMKSDVLALKGIRTGDVLIIDQTVEPQPGDIVCAQIEDNETLDVKTVFRVFQDPYLVAASFDDAGNRPEVVDNERVRLKGVMTELLRRRQ